MIDFLGSIDEIADRLARRCDPAVEMTCRMDPADEQGLALRLSKSIHSPVPVQPVCPIDRRLHNRPPEQPS
jgi:hypothetical protein